MQTSSKGKGVATQGNVAAKDGGEEGQQIDSRSPPHSHDEKKRKRPQKVGVGVQELQLLKQQKQAKKPSRPQGQHLKKPPPQSNLSDITQHSQQQVKKNPGQQAGHQTQPSNKQKKPAPLVGPTTDQLRQQAIERRRQLQNELRLLNSARNDIRALLQSSIALTSTTNCPTTHPHRLKLLDIQRTLDELISSESGYQAQLMKANEMLHQTAALHTLPYEVMERIMSFTELTALVEFRISVGDHNEDGMLNIYEKELFRRMQYSKSRSEFTGIVVQLNTGKETFTFEIRAPIDEEDQYDAMDTAIDKYCNYKKDKSNIFSEAFLQKCGLSYAIRNIEGVPTKVLETGPGDLDFRYICNGEEKFNEIARRKLYLSQRDNINIGEGDFSDVYSHDFTTAPLQNIQLRHLFWTVSIFPEDTGVLRYDNSNDDKEGAGNRSLEGKYITSNVKKFKRFTPLEDGSCANNDSVEKMRSDYHAIVRCLAYLIVNKNISKIDASGDITFVSNLDQCQVDEKYMVFHCSGTTPTTPAATNNGNNKSNENNNKQRIELIMTRSEKRDICYS